MITLYNFRKPTISIVAATLALPVFAAAPIEDYGDREYGGNSGNIASGTWTGGGAYNATIGDDVYIFSNEGSTNANVHGIYGNGTSTTTGGNQIRIDVVCADGDGIRSNPGGTTNAKDAKCTYIIGDDLTVWVRGESSDCVNLNGYSSLTVGDNAKFYACGTLKSGGEGSHGLRANFASVIKT